MTTERTFHVPGMPSTKGSTRSFYSPKAKRVVTMADNREEQKAWEARVALTARQSGAPFVTGIPIGIHVTFFIPRPKGDYRTGKHAGELRATAPAAPAKKPDVDKLLRAVLDGLTGVIYHDDAQVVEVQASKAYSRDGQAGARITVRYL